MARTLNDYKYTYLGVLGYTGALEDREQAWRSALGYGRGSLYEVYKAAGYSGSGPITMTVNSGVYVYATSATPALTIAEDDATVINNGKILGKGGTTGKEAIYISSSGVTITNASGAYIAGGGGDGSYSAVTNSGQGGGGGGAGGGGGQNDLFDNGVLDQADLEREEPKTNVEIVVQGSLVQQEELGTFITETLNESFGKQGVTLTDARFA